MKDFVEKLESDDLGSHTVSTREFHTATVQVGKDVI